MTQDKANVIGIDLGTSHASLATVDESGHARLLDIPQLASAHEIVSKNLLPSVYFHNQEYQDLHLPWQDNPPVLGEWARELAISNPDRAIVSAKSWLCYKGDLRLPPGASWSGLSAKEVSTLLLSHLISAWKTSELGQGQEITTLALTVPASFDPLARQLTDEAAKAAGIPNAILIEEPLAAFYAWLSANKDWNKRLKAGDSVLVCDVGGGTSDFSLILVKEESITGELELERIAVGRHLLLGGDNMDLALAHALSQKHGSLDHWQFISLQQQVRKAKEHLLSNAGEESYPLSATGRGSSLFSQTARLELTRSEVESLLVEGFFPAADEDVKVRRSTGLQAAGLPYEHDPAITHHLASFLRQAKKNAKGDEDGLIFKPTHILFNGGVFKAQVLQDRVVECVERWSQRSISLLQNPDLDHAVTLGAAYYASWKLSGNKLRVRTQAPRSYYIGLEANELAVPGMKPRLQGLCVLPQGSEEGSNFEMTSQEFALWGGEEVSFELFSSDAREPLGSVVADAGNQLDKVSRLACEIEDDGISPIPVFLESDYDETGTLRIAIREKSGDRRWDLNFQLREESL